MLGMLLVYDADGVVIGTLDYMVRYDAGGRPIGLVDFIAHEDAGGQVTDYLVVEDERIKGAKAWPEWIGGEAHRFRVELEGPPGRKRIAALVHRESGHRRARAAIEAAIAAVEPDATGARDIRHVVGGPSRHLPVDGDGKTAGYGPMKPEPTAQRP